MNRNEKANENYTTDFIYRLFSEEGYAWVAWAACIIQRLEALRTVVARRLYAANFQDPTLALPLNEPDMVD